MSLVPVLERLEALDIPALGQGGIALGLVDLERLKRFVEATEIAFAGRAATLAAQGTGAPPTEVIARGTRSSATQAARAERGAQTAAANPALGAALADGTVGLEHLEVYRAIERGLADDQQARLRALQPALLADAGAQTPEAFRRSVSAAARTIRRDDGETRAAQQRRDRSGKYGTNPDDGMGWLSARWDPETSARVQTYVKAERDRLLAEDPTLTFEQATADAIANLITSAGRATHPGRTEVVAFIDLESLRNGAHGHGVSYLSSGAEVPVSTIRRLCCEAHIIPMVLNGDGQPVDLGRGQRLANRAQRRALRKLHRTCAFPDCHVAFDECDIHHVLPFELGGPTDLGNLAPVCKRHHHLVHEGGWRLHLDTNRTVTVHRPDGTHHATRIWDPPAGEHPGDPPSRPPGDSTGFETHGRAGVPPEPDPPGRPKPAPQQQTLVA